MKAETEKHAGRPARASKHSTVRINLRVTPDEMKIIKQLAKDFNGNISALLRAKILGEKKHGS